MVINYLSSGFCLNLSHNILKQTKIQRIYLDIYPVGVYNSFDEYQELIKLKNKCICKTKERTDEEKKALINRLNRIEGQIRGIRKMVESNSYCTDILIQASAVVAAINSFNKKLLETHIKTCVANDIKENKTETVTELVEVLEKLMR